ncbi:TetR/AcrR family transcriptional regulator [Amycolatopsis sp. H20-H5]|uniref:TetR/AcrR family transcriptional regulator n=1 Tax=Amycolatopsis sp. H20-H5 TaxID=3046309 RepID=UPI002DB8CB96|nr:helix-turn-helix domain-containing protein [Amycolatopsis sp. H20-H5]MEC3976191.1 helix-turn-helix domain-containing protein [Amycolatopsis sp. H20-H5]
MTSGQKRRAYAARVPAEQRRSELLDAALHLVVAQGHHAATMDAVARQAGVTKPVIYGVFTSRAELLATLLRREQNEALKQLLAALPDRLEQRLREEPADLLAHVLTAFLDSVRESADRWHCVVLPMPDMPAEFHAARERARALVLKQVENMTQTLVDSGTVPAGLDAGILAHTVITLFEMAARLVLTDPEHFQPSRFLTTLRTAVGLATA